MLIQVHLCTDLIKLAGHFEESLGLKKRTKTRNTVRVEGQLFPSKLAAAKHYKIDTMVF